MIRKLQTGVEKINTVDENRRPALYDIVAQAVLDWVGILDLPQGVVTELAPATVV